MTDPNDIATEGLLRIPEAAAVLALSRSKLYELMDSGRLRNVRIDGARRIPREAVREFLAQHATPVAK